MDNKITKERLSNLLSYDWVAMIVFLVIGIIVFELAFAVCGVRLTTGQNFKYYYDLRIDNSLEPALIDVLFTENKTFSYDVMLINGEIVESETNALTSRLKVQEGDVIITDTVYDEESKEVRANSLIDFVAETTAVYNFNDLLIDGRKYLSEFLKDEFLGLDESEKLLKTKDKENLSTEKIDNAFLIRMKKDNRFRTDEQKETGKKYERERIFKLISELNDFEYLLEYGKTHDIFYNYTRFTQTSELAYREADIERYKTLVEAEKQAGRENAPYGLKVSGLTNGKHAPQELFKVSGGTDASNVVVMVFNFTEYQKELQFESVSFINSIVRSCSNIYQRDIV